MTMTRDLFLAILSLDSYNRGYAEGVKDLPESGQIGDAKIKTRLSSGIDATEFAKWQAAGFYAIAYDVSQVKDDNGKPLFTNSGTVIAYRGSDYADTGGFILTSNDVWQGWRAAAGFPFGGQPALARHLN